MNYTTVHSMLHGLASYCYSVCVWEGGHNDRLMIAGGQHNQLWFSCTLETLPVESTVNVASALFTRPV